MLTHTPPYGFTHLQRGMEQEYNLGGLLRRMYVNDTTGFLSKNYTRKQVHNNYITSSLVSSMYTLNAPYSLATTVDQLQHTLLM